MLPIRTATVRAYVGLGANLGEAPRTLAAAVRAMGTLPNVRLVAVSRLYRTRPVGVTEQAEFHNAAVALDVPRGAAPATGAMALLVALKGLERAFGRQARRRWGPRELDLDLLVYGRHRIRVPRPANVRSADPSRGRQPWLEVPHASARERLFVLAPLADLAPHLAPPGWHVTVARVRAQREAVEGSGAVRPIAVWDAATGGWIRGS